MTEDRQDRRDYESELVRSAYHDALPIGERLAAQSLLESPFFGFEGDVRMKPPGADAAPGSMPTCSWRTGAGSTPRCSRAAARRSCEHLR